MKQLNALMPYFYSFSAINSESASPTTSCFKDNRHPLSTYRIPSLLPKSSKQRYSGKLWKMWFKVLVYLEKYKYETTFVPVLNSNRCSFLCDCPSRICSQELKLRRELGMANLNLQTLARFAATSRLV